MTALDQLLAQQKKLNEEIEELRKSEKKTALATVVDLIKTYQIGAGELAKACGFEAPKELKKREPVKATPKYQWTDSTGKVNFWAGRGKNPPKELVAFCESKKITVKQFKEDKQYAYKG